MLKCGTEIIDLVVLGRNYWSSCRVFTLGESICENNSYAKNLVLQVAFKKMFHCILQHEKDPPSNDYVVKTKKSLWNICESHQSILVRMRRHAETLGLSPEIEIWAVFILIKIMQKKVLKGFNFFSRYLEILRCKLMCRETSHQIKWSCKITPFPL